ncbi:MAG: LysR substrate-binding domain-containing protein [Ramlibacter sp.]|nr:LysR substrate-binding domain-containing protein [Ramlibacter sp.]
MKAISRLPLNSLRVFEAVARLGSMARAAEALNVQPSAVSMQLKNLTDFVGLPLVVRAGRRLELTPHGAALLPSVVSGLGQIEDAVVSLRTAAGAQPFTVSVLPAFLHLWLLPRLARFEAANPSFRMRVIAGRERVDPARGEADAAIRLGDGAWPNLLSQKLMDENLVPVCSPALCKKVGRLGPGEVPVGVPLLQSAIDPWTRWSPRAHDGEQRSVAVDDAIAVVKAAQHGKGVALVRGSLAQDAIRDGTLVPVGKPIKYRWSYYWVTAPRSAQDERQLRILHWLMTEVAASQIP